MTAGTRVDVLLVRIAETRIGLVTLRLRFSEETVVALTKKQWLVLSLVAASKLWGQSHEPKKILVSAVVRSSEMRPESSRMFEILYGTEIRVLLVKVTISPLVRACRYLDLSHICYVSLAILLRACSSLLYSLSPYDRNTFPTLHCYVLPTRLYGMVPIPPCSLFVIL